MMHRISGLLACLLVCASCNQAADRARLSNALPTASPKATHSAVKKLPSSCVGRVFASLSVRQRVGQLFMLGLAKDQLGSTEAPAIRTDRFGSVWFTQKSLVGVQRIRAISDSIQRLAQAT